MSSIRPISGLEAFDSGVNISKNQIWVAVPGTIRSFDPDTVTCVVDMAIISGINTSKEDNISFDRLDRDSEDYLSHGCAGSFPRGGGCTLTFPIKAGDECLVVFSQSNIDFWWQNGGSQLSLNQRRHDFSDAFVIPGPQSQAKKISNISPTAAQLRTDDGSAFVEVSAGGDVTATSGGQITLNAPQVTINGNVQVNGSLTATGDVKAAVRACPRIPTATCRTATTIQAHLTDCATC